MKIETRKLWETTPGMAEEIPMITSYIPDNKDGDGAVIIFPGGGYVIRAQHEGEGYARFLAENGVTAFVVDYRVAPHKFPLPLADARRAIRTVRANAEKYGIDKNKIAVMGSSAGGHLAALVSTYTKPIEFENADEIDKEEFLPNAQILCYPVIKMLGKGIAHLNSGKNLLGDMQVEMGEELSPDLIVSGNTPPAFVWHTFDDNAVNVINSIDYIKALRLKEVSAECHIFPKGPHGLGLADGDDEVSRYITDWKEYLIKWLKYMNFKGNL